jgi:hypothetical protein
MDTVGHRLVLALASRLFHIFDLRKMDTPEQTRESSLKFLTRALACMSDGQGTHLTPTFPRSSSTPFFRVRHGVRGRPHRRRVLRPLASCPRKKVRIQVPPPDDRRRGPRLARKCARLPPDLQHLRLRRLRRHRLHLGPQGQKAPPPVPAPHRPRRRARLFRGRYASRDRRELHLG